GAVPRPVDNERVTLDVAGRPRAPEARVVALVAVVAHDEDVVGRHGVRGAAEADAAALEAATGPEQRVRRALHGRVRLAREEGGVRVVPRLAVDVDLPSAHLDRLPLDRD